MTTSFRITKWLSVKSQRKVDVSLTGKGCFRESRRASLGVFAKVEFSPKDSGIDKASELRYKSRRPRVDLGEMK